MTVSARRTPISLTHRHSLSHSEPLNFSSTLMSQPNRNASPNASPSQPWTLEPARRTVEEASFIDWSCLYKLAHFFIYVPMCMSMGWCGD